MANSELQVAVQGESLNVYAIVRRVSDSKVWDVTNTTWATWANGSIDDYDIALTEAGGDFYEGDFPEDIAKNTDVRVVYYKRAGASPAITDLLLASRRLTWNGVTLASGSSVALNSDALTSLESVKRQMRITGSTYDTLLTELINSVSERIKREASREFVATNYREWHSGTRSQTINLRQWPIIRVNSIAFGRSAGVTVSYTGSAIEATVAVVSTGLRLRSLAADGTETTTDLTFATYPTLSTMATAVAAVSDWTASNAADASAYRLQPQGGVDALSNSVVLDYADAIDYEYDVEERTGIVSLRHGLDLHGGSGASYGFGAVENTQRVPRGSFNHVIDYRAGYETIPDDLAHAANVMVQSAFDQGKASGYYKTESIGDYSYTLADTVQVDDEIRGIINRYKSGVAA